jgi:hypothetical protein
MFFDVNDSEHYLKPYDDLFDFPAFIAPGAHFDAFADEISVDEDGCWWAIDAGYHIDGGHCC